MSVIESNKDKEKKKALLKKNRRTQELFRVFGRMREDAEREREEREELLTPAPQPQNGDADVPWSAKTQEIRNRLTGKKRMACERWNRFAGTEGGGGRGL